MFFSRKKSLVAAVCFVIAGGSSCRQQPAGRIERVGILRFENLSGNPDLDWIAAATPRFLYAQLSGQATAVALSLERASDASRVGATELVSGYFIVRGNQLRGTLVVEDTATLSARTIVAESADAVSLLDSLSRQLGVPLRALPTRSNRALEQFGQSLRLQERGAGVENLEAAVKEDPGFGLAWVELANRSASADVISRALGQKALLPLERAILNVRAMGADASASERLARVEALAVQNPADGNIALQTAEFATVARRLDVALRWFIKLTQMNPADPKLWNSRAYAEAFGGDFEAAKHSLERYRVLAPNDPNMEDSQGEIYYMFGHFDEAEAAFKAGFAKQMTFNGGSMMRKAAWAKLRAGDAKSAASDFATFIEYRKSVKDAFVEQRLAIWEYLSGNKAAGKVRMEKLAADGLHPVAFAQLSIWARLEGDRSKAEAWALKAVQALPAMPQTRGAVAVAAVLSQPDASTEVWKARFQNQPVASIGMMASGDFEGAAAFLEQARGKMNPLLEMYWPDLEAVALYKTGKKDQAAKLLARYSLPENEEDSIVLGFAYPAEAEVRKLLKK